MTGKITTEALLVDGIISRLDEQGQKQCEQYVTKLREATKEAKAAGETRFIAWMMALSKVTLEIQAENS